MAYTLEELKKMSGSTPAPTTSAQATEPTSESSAYSLSDLQRMGGQPKKGFLGRVNDTLQDIAVGTGKGVLSFAKGIGTLGGSVMRLEERLIDKAMGTTGTPSMVAPIFTPGSEQSNKADELLKGDNAAEKFGKFVPDAAAFIAPGTKILALEKAMASNVPKALVRYLPQINARAAEIITKASTLGIRSATEGLSNYGIAYLSSGGDKDEAASVGKFAAVLPGVGFGLKALREPVLKLFGKGAEASINSLIKPLLKDFSYGKDPARGVIKEGIVANNMDELFEKIGESRQKIGNDIGTINEMVDGKVTFDATRAFAPIDAAIDTAVKNNDKAVFERLDDIKTALMNDMTHAGGKIIPKAEKDLSNISGSAMFGLKKTIGDMTKFTGNPTDDKAVNSALKQVYGKLKEMYNSGVTKVDPKLGKQVVELNERYADLTSAEIAAKHADQLGKRRNLISLAGHVGLGFGVVGGIITGNWKAAAGGLIAELAGRALGSTAAKTRIAKFLAGIAAADRAAIMNQSPTLQRIFGEFSPLPTNEKAAVPGTVQGVYKTGERYPALPAPAPGTPRTQVGSGATIKVAPTGSNMESTARGPFVQ